MRELGTSLIASTSFQRFPTLSSISLGNDELLMNSLSRVH
ncbi:hypothetical protein VCR6J2_350122 [Vibrio coralliirubri]|nr:hypothetical protein VCR1J2_220428 [Vibrio coralliirubri]CDT29677.1 hypothetical protein VCR6J2_350122 [Vibrio coralliirubri]